MKWVFASSFESILLGRFVNWNEHKSIVYIENQDLPGKEHDCTGVLIEPNVVLTSLNCIFDGQKYYNFYLFAYKQSEDSWGTFKRPSFENGNGIRLEYKKIYRHPNYEVVSKSKAKSKINISRINQT